MRGRKPEAGNPRAGADRSRTERPGDRPSGSLRSGTQQSGTQGSDTQRSGTQRSAGVTSLPLRTTLVVVGAASGTLAAVVAMPDSVQHAPTTAAPVAAAATAVACAVIGGCAGAAAAIDLELRRVPNRLAAVVFGAGLVASTGLMWGDGVPAAAADRVSEHLERLALGVAVAVTGCVLAGMPMLLVRIVRGLGMGDVKLAGALGASLMARGWWVPLAAVAVAAAAAATAGGIMGRTAMPLAPFLAIGWLAAMLLVPAIQLVPAMQFVPAIQVVPAMQFVPATVLVARVAP